MEQTFYERVGRRIADLRRARSLSQETLAESAGIGASYVARIEVGTRRPTLDVLGSIAGALDVPLTRLVASDERESRYGSAPGPAEEVLEAIGQLAPEDVEFLALVARRLKLGPARGFVAGVRLPGLGSEPERPRRGRRR